MGIGRWIWTTNFADKQICRLWRSFTLPATNAVRKANLYTEAFEGDFELVIRSSIEIRGGDEIVAGLQDIIQCQELSRLPGCCCQRRHTSFECRHALFKHIGGGVHDPGVDIAKLFQPEEIGGMFRTVKSVRSGLVDRNSP